MKNGYTLIELMIAMTIISIVVSMGISAYGRAQDKQIGQSAAEQIVSVLKENQTIASIGAKDCTGKFVGQQVSIIADTNELSAKSLCDTNPPDGAIVTTSIPGILFTSSYTIIFNPLSLGAALTSNPLQIAFKNVTGTIYSIRIHSSGTIENLGIQ